MPTIHDTEFGDITIRRSVKAKQVRVKLTPAGKLQASLPAYMPLFLVKRLIASSRATLRDMLASHTKTQQYIQGTHIGDICTIVARDSSRQTTHIERHGNQLTVHVPKNRIITDSHVQNDLRTYLAKLLRQEAKKQLPKQLRHLADTYGFSYERVRFSHAAGRWGSCSSSGTISLNIALMKLPDALRRYVLVHELAHTKQMNHSKEFWRLVEQMDSQYKIHKAHLKNETPSI